MPENPTSAPTGHDVAGSSFFKRFLSKAEDYINQPTRLKKLLTDAYAKASQKNEVGHLAREAWDTLQTIFRLIKASASGEYTGVPATTVAAAVAVLVYFISPIDVIPDFIPVLGLLDDVALVAWFSATLKGELDKFHEWEATRPAVVAEPETQKMAAAASASAMNPRNNVAAAPYTTAQPAAESAKHAGISPNTDAGLGSPDSSSDQPVHTAGPDATPTGTGNAAALNTDSSRQPNDGATATGGNVR